MNSKQKILIVDDDESMRISTRMILKSEGYDVETAEDGARALEKTAQVPYHLILLDVTLPDVLGVDLIPKIKYQHPDTGIIIATAYATLETAIQAINSGASAYITKPFNIEAMLQIIHQTLEKQRLILENQRLLKDLQNELAQRIRAEEELRRIQSDLEIQVSARTRQLTLANRELEQFVYSSYHDLRSPVRAIKLFSELALRTLPKIPETSEYLHSIMGESERLFKLLDSILIHGRLGKFAENLEAVSVLDVLQSLTQKIRPQIEEIQAQLTLPETDAWVMGNPTLLHQIFANLLDNALKYQRPGGEPQIDVHISQNATQVFIDVKDNGIGIPSEYYEKIFQIFQRLHTSDEYPGAGIGLATVKKSVELMNGTVKVSSVLQEGTTFHLAFPKANPDSIS